MSVLRTIARVVSGEGIASAVVRAAERLEDGARGEGRRAAGLLFAPPQAALVNLLTMPAEARLGGVPVQWLSRLRHERGLRDVVAWSAGTLTAGPRAWPVDVEALRAVRALVIEGPFADLPPLADDVQMVLAIHDFSFISSRTHELVIDPVRLAVTGPLLERARAVIFPSMFLRDSYLGVLPELAAHVIEPGIDVTRQLSRPTIRKRIAFCGSVKPHKGGALLPELMRATPAAEWHLFGGGDVDLLRAARAASNARVHGYYRAGSLPRLLARNEIGLAVLPSVVPESFSLTLSECWSAGVPVVAFDDGAIAARIRAHGGGFLVPLDAGADGLAAAVRAWQSGATVTMPSHVPTAQEAAASHGALYRALGLS